MISYVMKYTKKCWKMICFLMGTSVILSFFNVLVPLITGKYLDELLIKTNKETIVTSSVILIIFAIFQMICSYCHNIISEKVTVTISNYMINDLIEHLNGCSLLVIETMNPIYIVQRITNDVNSITSFVISFTSGCIFNFVMLVSCYVFIIVNSPLIAVIIFLTNILNYFVIKYMKPRLEEATNDLKEKSVFYLSTFQDEIKNIKNIRVYNISKYYQEKFNFHFKNLLNSRINNKKLGFILMSNGEISRIFLQIFLFVYGGYSICEGKMSVGIFITIFSYFGYVINSVAYFINLAPSIVDASVAYERIDYFFNIDMDSKGQIQIERLKNVAFENVSFYYNENKIIDNFSYIFESGKMYLIKGENGSGKTTLISLMIGLYINEYLGSIMFNSIDIKRINMDLFREKLLGIILQEPFILEDTLVNNLYFRNIKLDFDDKIADLLDRYALGSFKNRLNLELKEEIISGGELKKIEIIRMFLKQNINLLVLDEPTVFLDEKSKIVLANELNMNKKDKIIIIISHDDTFDGYVDEIIEVK